MADKVLSKIRQDGDNYIFRDQNAVHSVTASSNGKISVDGSDVTAYTHPTSAGNKHVPSGGSSGQFLGWDSAGTAKWVNNPAAGKADAATTLSGYGITDAYTKTETDTLLNGKVQVVATLPASGSTGTVYYVGPSGSGADQYEEYIWDATNSQFIKVGEKSVDLSDYLKKNGDGKDVTVTFTQAGSKANINSTESLATMFGKIKKWYASMGDLAWKSNVSDSDISGTISDTHIASASTWNAKQDALATQTAYTSKGTATKVPQITTNSLGQVTGITEVTISGVTPASHTHGNISNTGTLTDTAAAAAGNDYVVIRDADNAKVQTSTIKGTDVADAVSKKHSHSTLTLSTTAQAYDGTHTLALPSSDPYTSARTPSSHTHGNIQNGGTLQTNDITIASGDKLVVTDSSDSSKVARTSVSFDGSTTTTALTPKGTFEAFAKSGDITSAINALDAEITSTDGTNVQAKVTETNGKITAVNITTDNTAYKEDSVYYVAGTTDYAAWVANHAYAVNDEVVYGGKAYKCSTAHTSGSSFDSGKWTAIATPVLKGTISDITALYTGMKIAYKWPITGGSSSTYLNINGLGNVYIRRNDGNTTTHLPMNAVCILTYDGTYWRWADYDSGNTYDRTYTNAGKFTAGATGCNPYAIVCLDSAGKYSMLISAGSGTGTSKTINTAGKFSYPSTVLYYNANNTVAANTVVTSGYATYISFPNIDIRYSTNYGTTSNPAFTTFKPVYIECTLNGDGTWSPTEKAITQTLATGKYYIYLGISYSTAYQLSLATSHPMLYYDGTNLVSADLARGDIAASSTNGNINVAGTDVTVYAHPTTEGNKHIPSGGSSGQYLAWDSAGTAKWVSNPNSDTKVKATAKTDNVNYKILATASASPTSGNATEAVYDTDITLNPSTNTIAANISGDAATASAAKSGSALETAINGKAASSHTHGNISNTGTLTDTAAAAAGNDYVVIRDADNAKIQTSTIKGTDVADAVSKKHDHSTLTLSTTAQAYDGTHTLALPASDPYTSARTPASHTHGNIQNGGTLQTTDVTIANGDKLVVTDASDSNKVARTSVSFDGSTTTKALTPKGTFESFATASDISTAIQALDVSSVGGAGKYISAISETDGKISATATTMDTTPTANSTNAVTSGGIKTALDAKGPNVPSEVTIATGDKLVVTDASDGNKVKRASISFDTGVTNTFLQRSGTFGTVKERDLDWGGNFRTTKSPTETFTKQNSFFYPKPSAVSVEYSNNRTAETPTWTDYGLTDNEKRALFSGNEGAVSVYCGKKQHVHPGYTGSAPYKDLSNENIADQGLRITIACRSLSNRTTDTDSWIYCYLRGILIYMSTQSAGNGAHCVIEKQNGVQYKNNSDEWVTLGDYKIQGDSGWNSIPYDGAFGGGWSQTSNYSWVIRFTIWSDQLNASPNSGQTGCLLISSIAAINHIVWSATNPVQRTGLPFSYSYDGTMTLMQALPLGSGGTGKTTAKAAEYNLTTGKSEISDTTSGDDRVMFELASPSESNGVTRGFRKLSTVWTWVKGLLSSESGVNISGNAATATSAGKLTTARKTYVTLGTASTTTTRDWSGDTTIPVDGTLGVGNGGTGKSSVTSNSFLVGNGSSAMVEKTPAEVLSLIGAQATITYMTTDQENSIITELGDL